MENFDLSIKRNKTFSKKIRLGMLVGMKSILKKYLNNCMAFFQYIECLSILRSNLNVYCVKLLNTETDIQKCST